MLVRHNQAHWSVDASELEPMLGLARLSFRKMSYPTTLNIDGVLFRSSGSTEQANGDMEHWSYVHVPLNGGDTIHLKVWND